MTTGCLVFLSAWPLSILKPPGGKATYDRITELAIILVDEGKVVEVWQSLINPQRHIPPWITRVTGISNDMVSDQPTFETLWPEIDQRLQDRVLVAHNARFDYGFLKNEAERIQQPLNLKTLCSVKLSRYLYPQYSSHGLDAIIQRLGVSVSHRHRALDDAMVIVQLFQVMSAEFNADDISKACQRLRPDCTIAIPVTIPQAKSPGPVCQPTSKAS